MPRSGARSTVTLPDGSSSLTSAITVLRAAMGALGVERMLLDATAAVDLEPPGSPWHPAAMGTLASPTRSPALPTWRSRSSTWRPGSAVTHDSPPPSPPASAPRRPEGTSPGLLTEGVLREQLRGLSADLAREGGHVRVPSPMALSKAEMRVLQLLPTHLSLAEIGVELHTPRNTV